MCNVTLGKKSRPADRKKKKKSTCDDHVLPLLCRARGHGLNDSRGLRTLAFEHITIRPESHVDAHKIFAKCSY